MSDSSTVTQTGSGPLRCVGENAMAGGPLHCPDVAALPAGRSACIHENRLSAEAARPSGTSLL